MLANKKYAPEDLGDVLILGLGASGKAAVTYLAPLLGGRVKSLSVAAGVYSEANQAFIAPFEEQGVKVAFDHFEIQGDYDLCIASPGISMFEPFYQSAAASCKEVISEVEFAWRESDADSSWIAITGTNGKTTTTALAAHLACACGMKAAAVGNIGDTCLTAVASGQVELYVAEVSSYQLASTSKFAPQVAVLTNITPDHLHWHKSHEAYSEAKQKVFANLPSVSESLAILDATDEEARALARAMRQNPDRGYEYLAVGTKAGLASDMRETCGATNSAFVDNGVLTVCFGDTRISLVTTAELQIKGAHNVSNALVASAAVLKMGADPSVVRQALKDFAPLEHRIEPAGSVNGIACYNDSKATNVDATLVALSAFEPQKPVVLLGGQDKGTDLEPLVTKCNQYARAVVCYGEAKARFLEAFSAASIPVLEAAGMADALEVALATATGDDVILLSPACASFDEFRSFEHRGDVFKRLVAEHQSEGETQ